MVGRHRVKWYTAVGQYGQRKVLGGDIGTVFSAKTTTGTRQADRHNQEEEKERSTRARERDGPKERKDVDSSVSHAHVLPPVEKLPFFFYYTDITNPGITSTGGPSAWSFELFCSTSRCSADS
ncbi:unnamed protein product [Ectocarpus sp. 4 AP-2014]